MHYTHQGNRKWTERAMPHLERMQAVEQALALLEAPAKPYPDEVELPEPWPTSSDPEQVIIAMEGTITRVTQARKPAELGPYPNALMTVEYTVHESWGEGKKYEPKRIVFALPSVVDRQVAVPAGFKVGDRHVVVGCSYPAQPKKVQQMPLDDDIQELELPIYYGVALYDEYPPKNRGTWMMGFTRRYHKGDKGLLEAAAAMPAAE
jgi:hypothetical protein